jgi:lipoyl synthase
MRIQTQTKNAFTEQLKKNQQALPKPAWLKIRPPTTDRFANIKALQQAQKLHTVCQEAHCPNMSECWSGGTATFMILGDTCTRACRFCMIKSGNPKKFIDKDEPKKLAEAVREMDLKYVVLTCVTRDDLDDGGAQHFADCINALRTANPEILVEVLISDLNGNKDALKIIVAARPDVLAHNVETVERLQGEVRDPRANYKKSLSVLENAKKIAAASTVSASNPAPASAKPASAAALPSHAATPAARASSSMPTPAAAAFPSRAALLALSASSRALLTKSSIMVGLGETAAEITQTMKDLRAVNTDILTVGQYLQPSQFHYQLRKYVTPQQFNKYEQLALKLGFLYCASGPFVRSSYRAGELFIKHHVSRPIRSA